MIVDTNVYLGRWPFRRLAGDEPPALVARLKKRGVTEAWAGSFDALLHEDVGAVNLRVAEDCRRYGEGILRPVGAVNPRLPDWEEDLRRCHEVLGMHTIRLHPNYQSYRLTDIAPLFEQVARRKMLLQIAVQMEDTRTQHPLMPVTPVNMAGLAEMAARYPALRVQVVNGNRVDPTLLPVERISFDIAMVEGALGLTNLLRAVNPRRVLFGSCSPLFYWESSQLKAKEAGLSDAASKALFSGNAAQLMREVKA